MGDQFIYEFGDGKAAGNAGMKALLGGKGANLAEMAGPALRLPVPPGFTISTQVCTEYYKLGGKLPDAIEPGMRAAVAEIERLTGTRFGDAERPLLLSVRSGARVSMPGMMDTVLNLGLNDRTCEALARESGDARFAWDSYRRFVHMYGDVVLGLKPQSARERDPFELLLERKKEEVGIGAHGADTALTAEHLRDLVARYKAEIKARLGIDFPDDPWQQLLGGVRAVFSSWNGARAVEYRKIYHYPDDWGTAVTVMAMVFGNLGEDSGTGVAFTRDANTGVRHVFADYLQNAQGEDVVAGIRNPGPLARADRQPGDPPSLEELQPAAYAELMEVFTRLEGHYKDMQDVEFTVQRGKLWILQTRTGKRSARAMVKIACDMVSEGLIDRDTALARLEPGKLDELLHPTIDADAAEKAGRKPIARGVGASPGGASGRVVFSADDAAAWHGRGEAVILVRAETSPEDIHGMKAAEGILTARGGMTSHAAVVGRGMGKCCVVGCSQISISYEREQFVAGTVVVKKGDVISIDGTRGDVYLGTAPLKAARLDEDFATVMRWSDEVRRLGVRTNADTPTDAAVARGFGAEGIGLCRTEHMFFSPERILAVREMILADDEAGRRHALDKILPMQRGDFDAIFTAMAGLPVTVRLLDPPLHEFVPHEAAEIRHVAEVLGKPVEAVEQRLTALHESNPKLGHRGCRLAVTFPEIYEVQVRAIAEACLDVRARGIDARPEIMIPIVGLARELETMRALTLRILAEVAAARGATLDLPVGTMIELPRACMTADKIAAHADFFSFGTNDLTQTTMGISRDDAASFLPAYVARGLLARDPFVAIDRDGVGALMRLAVDKGRATHAKLKIGICGEHGGEPSSVAFCHELGLDYVSCSPFRVPIARLAAAQAALAHKG